MSKNTLNSQSSAIITKQISNNSFIFPHSLWCRQLQESTSLCFCIRKNLKSVSFRFQEWEVEVKRILYPIRSKRCDNRKEPHQNIRDSCATKKVRVISKSYKIGYPVRGDIHLREHFIEVVVKRFESFVKDRVVKWRGNQEVRGKQRRKNSSGCSVSVCSSGEGESSKCLAETKEAWWERYEWKSSKTALEEELTICEELI
jgi:hypothetical protein